MIAQGVAPGQVWMDNDPRVHLHGRRFVEVLGVEDNYAVVRGFRIKVSANHKGHKVPSRTTHIRLDRFKPTKTGYVRVS